jgi:hypothetical protein
MKMEIALVTTSVIAVYFFIRSFKLSLRNAELKEKIESQNRIIDIKSNAVQESFLKFVSDSREWAYEYIEDVQKGLKKFVDGIESEIAYFDEYGVVGDAYPHYHSMKKISQEYKELKKLLPEESNA